MMEYIQEIAGILSLQLYDDSSCKSFLEYARRMNAWTPAIVSVSKGKDQFASLANPETRSASAFTPNCDSEITTDFDERLNRIVKPLIKQVWRVDLERHQGTHLVRYVPGDYYAPHTDTGLNLLHRYFTVLCYLNEDFEGGQTSFPRLGYSLAPRTGKVAIFPATAVHCAEPITRGEKYILVSWLLGPIPINWI